MKFLQQIKENIGTYMLDQRLKDFKRERQACSLHNAKEVGIVFSIQNESDFDQIKTFLHDLAEKKINILVMAYVHEKRVPDKYLFWKGINILSKNDLNWMSIPTSNQAVEFMNKPFDILIDLNTHPVFPISYLVQLSQARFKVGPVLPSLPIHDFMIEIKNNDIQYFIEQLHIYLEMIHTRN
jgi:hypothetical protein